MSRIRSLTSADSRHEDLDQKATRWSSNNVQEASSKLDRAHERYQCPARYDQSALSSEDSLNSTFPSNSASLSEESRRAANSDRRVSSREAKASRLYKYCIVLLLHCTRRMRKGLYYNVRELGMLSTILYYSIKTMRRGYALRAFVLARAVSSVSKHLTDEGRDVHHGPTCSA